MLPNTTGNTNKTQENMTQTAAVAAAGYMSGRPFPFACESEGKRLDKTALIMATHHINHLDWHHLDWQEAYKAFSPVE